MHIKGWETLCCTTLPEKPADHKTANFTAFLYEDILELRVGLISSSHRCLFSIYYVLVTAPLWGNREEQQ